MKNKLLMSVISVATAGFACASQGLYYIGSESQESIPLKWTVGVDASYDSNVTPGTITKNDSFGVSPYVGMSFLTLTPQTTWDVYARLGCIYYFDKAAAMTDDLYTQARVGVNLTHRFSERLRLSSRNFVSYELEPDYSYGFATTRAVGEYLYWQTDNALGFRWSERLATYTGFSLTDLDYQDTDVQDRFTWTVYNQFRYQLNPQQSVLSLDYRYAENDGGSVASDSNDQYLLFGLEHRFSPNFILIARAGAQLHDVDAGDRTTNPYAEITLRNQINEQVMVRAFVRYGNEVYDTVQGVGLGIYDFDQNETLRIGLSTEYAFSQMLTAFGGVDIISSDYNDGRLVLANPLPPLPPARVGGFTTNLVNLYLGVTVKFTDNLFGTATVNYTDSNSDFANQDYDRVRGTIGIRYQF